MRKKLCITNEISYLKLNDIWCDKYQSGITTVTDKNVLKLHLPESLNTLRKYKNQHLNLILFQRFILLKHS